MAEGSYIVTHPYSSIISHQRFNFLRMILASAARPYQCSLSTSSVVVFCASVQYAMSDSMHSRSLSITLFAVIVLLLSPGLARCPIMARGLCRSASPSDLNFHMATQGNECQEEERTGTNEQNCVPQQFCHFAGERLLTFRPQVAAPPAPPNDKTGAKNRAPTSGSPALVFLTALHAVFLNFLGQLSKFFLTSATVDSKMNLDR